MMLIEKCICGSEEEFGSTVTNGVRVADCRECGTLHQRVDMTREEYREYYEEDYHKSVYTHDFSHDYSVAKERMVSYGNLLKGKVLDVGCGNAAFVQALADSGLDSYGCDLHLEGEGRLYKGELTDINFPSYSFDVVTCHDVLEHVVDIPAFLKEVRRIVKDDGHFILDFPRFFSREGRHHWKDKEHIWFLSDSMLRYQLASAGFGIREVVTPVPGKATYYCLAKKVNRKKILVPPGIGDSFWCLCKLESFCEKNDIGIPDLYVATTRADRNRAFDFVKRFPFIHAVGYYEQDMRGDPVWKGAYHKDGSGIMENVHGFDWFLSANGPFRFDKSLDQIIPGYDANWYPPMFVDNREHEYGKSLQDELGDYVVLFFTDHGMYQRWIEEFSIEQIVKTLSIVKSKLGVKLVFTGADWDLNNINMRLTEALPDDLNLIGKTDITAFLGALRYSKGCIGYCGGNTIFSTILKKPTLIFWNSFYNESFWRYSCPPDSLGKWYKPLGTRGARPLRTAEEFVKLWENQYSQS